MAKVKKQSSGAPTKKVLLKDIVIPKGTIFQRSPNRTERYGPDHFSCIIGLSQNTTGCFEYCIDDDPVEMSEYFANVDF